MQKFHSQEKECNQSRITSYYCYYPLYTYSEEASRIPLRGSQDSLRIKCLTLELLNISIHTLPVIVQLQHWHRSCPRLLPAMAETM